MTPPLRVVEVGTAGIHAGAGGGHLSNPFLSPGLQRAGLTNGLQAMEIMVYVIM